MALMISLPLICSVIAFIWISTQSCYGLYFSHNIEITKHDSSPILSYQTAITQKGNAYVVWVDNETIYFKSSQGNENKFGPKIVLSENNTSASSPQIAATEKGNVYVMWINKNNTTGYSNIDFRSSNNSGENFSNVQELGDTDVLSLSPQLAATEKGNVYVVWKEENSTTGHSNIMFRSSNNSGGNFSNVQELGDTDILSFSPQLAATEKGNVYVVWVDIKSETGDSDISFRSSNNSGENFAKRKEIRGGKILSFSPQLAATEKGNVYVVWVDIKSETGDSDISFRSSNNSGENFAKRKEIRGGKILSFSPQLAATEKGNVHVIWADKDGTTEDTNIAFRSSSNNGESFDSRVYLNRDKNKLTKSSSPQIAATEKGDLYAAWVEGNIKFRQILDKDIQTGQTISLSKITSTSSTPHIMPTENGNVYVVWTDKNSPGIGETLFFKRISESFFNRNS